MDLPSPPLEREDLVGSSSTWRKRPKTISRPFLLIHNAVCLRQPIVNVRVEHEAQRFRGQERYFRVKVIDLELWASRDP